MNSKLSKFKKFQLYIPVKGNGFNNNSNFNESRSKTNSLLFPNRKLPQDEECSPMILDNNIVPHLNVVDRGAFGAYFIFGYKITKRISKAKKQLMFDFYHKIMNDDADLLHFLGLPLNGSIQDCVYNGKPSSQYLIQHFQGKTLRTFVREENYNLKDLISIHKQLMYVIDRIHFHGYFHRDITSDNIIIHDKSTPNFRIQNNLENPIQSKWKVALIDFDRLQKIKTIESKNTESFSLEKRRRSLSINTQNESSNACVEEILGKDCSQSIIIQSFNKIPKNELEKNTNLRDLFHKFQEYAKSFMNDNNFIPNKNINVLKWNSQII